VIENLERANVFCILHFMRMNAVYGKLIGATKNFFALLTFTEIFVSLNYQC